MRRIALMFIAMGLMSAASHAALLGVTQHNPDIFSDFVGVSYNSTTGVFTAFGFPESLDLPGTPVHNPEYQFGDPGVAFGTWTLSMTVNPSDGALISGSLTVTGAITDFGSGPTLLTGTLLKYGSAALASDDKFDFEFHTTGGDLATIYGPKFGVILDAGDTGFNGGFATDFDNSNLDFGGVSDTSIIVPSPMAAPAGLIMLGLLSGFRRQRDRE